ncbi:hypothetical protein [uncultured Roseobacter sp.]|uniref:hypothetical protein n=1 Tax=uncultured Roseobacter sp. TaxID=114847 RepID=UPI0026382E0D|nr:hypothetical protein [uncultured Roseobacter sp.]
MNNLWLQGQTGPVEIVFDAQGRVSVIRSGAAPGPGQGDFPPIHFPPDGVTGGGTGPAGDFEPVDHGFPVVHFPPDGVTGGGNGPSGDTVRKICTQCGKTLPQVVGRATDGRYLGGNHKLALDLRVDFQGSKVISGDLFGVSFGQRDFVTSFRTKPGLMVSVSDPQPWPVIYQTADHTTVPGTLALTPGSAPKQLKVTLYADGRVPGLPQRQRFDMSAEWSSTAMRQLGVELERERGTEAPPIFDKDGDEITYEKVFAKAGIEVVPAGTDSLIPREAPGWGTAELHALMVEMAEADTSRAAWRQQLLWLGKSKRPGLLGVMFDTSAVLPRQGTAVFDGEIRERVSTQTHRKIIQTTAHEIGHGLNLAHRFEREVGHADSTSIMNYDWRYRGGNRAAEFWDKFDFSFDLDELEFLRHAPRHAVIPGGSAFHSVPYWKDGSGNYTPYAPEVPLTIVDLHLDPPIGGPVIMLGQPLFVQVTLTNRSGQPMQLDRKLLDPKGSFLEVLVRRVGTGGPGHEGAHHFQPIVERCMDLDFFAMDTVQDGQSISDNIQIHYGSGGFAFAEPGLYEIQVLGTVFQGGDPANPFDDRELIAPSNVLTIQVAAPKSMADEQDVVKLLRPDIGTFIALGGSAALNEARQTLEEVLENRSQKGKPINDPIAANIQRCFGIDAGRRYRRYAGGRFTAKDGDHKAAMEALKRLGRDARNAFDKSTYEATQRLIKRHEGKQKKDG